MTDYAIFRTGGKQYRVSPGTVLDVEKLPVQPGDQIELDDVLAVSRDGDLLLGQPTVTGARVVAQVQAQTRDRKIIVFKYKRKVRYRRKKGHRQSYTRLTVREFLLEGEEAALWEETEAIVLEPDLPIEEDGAEEQLVAEAEAQGEEEGEAEEAQVEEPVVQIEGVEEPAAEGAAEEGPVDDGEAPPAPRRRRTRKPRAKKADAEGDDATQTDEKEGES